MLGSKVGRSSKGELQVCAAAPDVDAEGSDGESTAYASGESDSEAGDVYDDLWENVDAALSRAEAELMET